MNGITSILTKTQQESVTQKTLEIMIEDGILSPSTLVWSHTLDGWKSAYQVGKIKNRHGLDKARYYGLAIMKFQAVITAIAVNVKRMVNTLTGHPRCVIVKYRCARFVSGRVVMERKAGKGLRNPNIFTNMSPIYDYIHLNKHVVERFAFLNGLD